jgi:hypothetical protein
MPLVAPVMKAVVTWASPFAWISMCGAGRRRETKKTSKKER